MPLPAPNMLGYATLDADDLPPSIPEVDAAIDQGEKPKRLLRRFRRNFTRPRSLECYIAKSFRNRFPAATVDGHCVECGEPTDYIATVQWRVAATQRLVSFRLMWSEAPPPIVRTNHAWCERCVEAWLKSIRLSIWIVWIGRWLARIAIMLFIGSILLRSLLPRDRFYVLHICFLLPGLILSWVGTWMFRRRAPGGMTTLMPKWLRIVGIDEYETRADRFASDARVCNEANA